MKKIFLVITLLILFTGCTTNYNLNIDNNNIKEEIDLNIPANLSTKKKDKIDNYFDNNITVFTNVEKNNDKFYELNKSFVKDGYIYKLNYNYKFDELYNSKVLNNCFDDFQYINNDEYIALKISGGFYCLYDNSNVFINIKTNNLVSSQNATEVKDNNYKWILNKDNENKVDIEFMMYKNRYSNILSKNKTGFIAGIKNIFITIILIGFIAGSGFLVNKLLKNIDRV